MERKTGIEPATFGLEADILPLNYFRSRFGSGGSGEAPPGRGTHGKNIGEPG